MEFKFYVSFSLKREIQEGADPSLPSPPPLAVTHVDGKISYFGINDP
jgi:hypothetical protein